MLARLLAALAPEAYAVAEGVGLRGAVTHRISRPRGRQRDEDRDADGGADLLGRVDQDRSEPGLVTLDASRSRDGDGDENEADTGAVVIRAGRTPSK